MTDSTVATGLTVQQWDAKFFKEYLEANRFKREMGTSTNNIIQVKSDLTKKKGDSITFSLVNRLTGAGVTGSSTLEGNEEALDSRSFKLVVDKIRNAVRVAEVDEQFSAISLRTAGKEVLKDWMMEKCRDDIITALHMINGVAYGSASEAQKDVWLVDNADRVLFGDAIGNGSYTDHSADLLTVTAAMTLSAADVQLMKRICSTASPRFVRPALQRMSVTLFFTVVHELSEICPVMQLSLRQTVKRGLAVRTTLCSLAAISSMTALLSKRSLISRRWVQLVRLVLRYHLCSCVVLRQSAWHGLRRRLPRLRSSITATKLVLQ